MRNLFWLAALSAAIATPASADTFLFDFTGTVLSETRPTLSVTPRPITGSLTYEAPAGGAVTTLMGNAALTTSLYGDFTFTEYSTTLSDSLFTFSGTDVGGQRFSLRASALGNGSYGYVGAGDGFSLTGTPVNASGRLSGSFAVAAGVPEPSAWMLLIGGFGALGGALRFARRSTRVSIGAARHA